ncbi:MAG: protein kinase [Myxococcota bacterium]
MILPSRSELETRLARVGHPVDAWIGRGAHGVVARSRASALKVGRAPDLEAEWRAGQALCSRGLLTAKERIDLGEEFAALRFEYFAGEAIDRALRPPAPKADVQRNLPMAFGYVMAPLGRSSYVHCGEVAESRLRRLLDPLATSLHGVHQAGWVHLDVAPDNVLVNGHDLRLADFGLARPLGNTLPDLAVGSAAYLAPELATRAPTAAADWYSLGVLVFLLLTGGLPFEGGGPEALVRKQSVSAPRVREYCPEVSADLDELVAGLLRRNEHTRFGAAQVLALGA